LIHTTLKYQGKTPLDCQYTLNKKKTHEGQEGKIGLFQGWVPVGGEWAQGKVEWGCIWWMCFVSIYENRRMTLVEIVLRGRMMEAVT
jgi:hypothetical protein